MNSFEVQDVQLKDEPTKMLSCLNWIEAKDDFESIHRKILVNKKIMSQ